MANPLPDEKEVYQIIEDKKLTIPREIWKLLIHHIANDLQVISLASQHLTLTPHWIIKTGTAAARVWHRLTLRPGNPPRDVDQISRYIMERVKNIDTLLQRLEETAVAKGELSLEEGKSGEDGIAG